MKSHYQKNCIIRSGVTLLMSISLFFLMISSAVIAQEHGKMSNNPDHIIVMPETLKWTDGPASLPPGAKFAVIDGDPKVAALFAMRIWLPAGFKIQPHWHPAEEHVTVISGSFLMGLGDKFEDNKLQVIPVGGFAVMKTGTRHFAMTKEESIIQLHGMGPWGINYVNPADDPRNK